MAATVERPARWYSSREDAKSFINIDSTISDKDARIDAYLAAASRLIENYTGRRFIPVTATKTLDWAGATQIILGDDLLSLTTLQDDNGTIASSDYWLYPEDAADYGQPYLWVELLFTTDYFAFDDTRQQAISIAGKWGYSELTRAPGSLLNGAISSTTTTSVVVDDGTEFDIGQTLLIDSEQMFIKNIATNTLTVERGMNGTTAATHTDDTTVNIIEPPPDIHFACNVLVARFLHRADAAWSDRAGDPTAGFTYYRSLPTEVKEILDRYKRLVHRYPRLVGRQGSAGTWGNPFMPWLKG